jgi:(R,R)-butanediol dehydrogenase/meso-butanediol dehydrogenase/diacetyl reductase
LRAAATTGTTPVLGIVELPDPAPGPGEIVLRTRAAGICGSDLHLVQAYPDFPGVVLGHELSGEVVALGEGVEGYAEGDLVAGFPLVGCGRCAPCLDGRVSKCPQMELVGVQRPGAYAEYVTVTARDSFVLPSGLTAEQGALVEPLAVAHHALERTRREAGAPVLVLGAGPVGAAVALWALRLGASDVVVSDPLEHRRKLVESLGATAVDPSEVDVATAFADLTGALPTAVVECVGVPGLIQHATEVVASDGHVTLAGACTKPDTFSPLTATAKELTLQFVLYYRRQDFAATIAQLAAGRLDASPLVTDCISLDDLPDRFQALMQPTTECKVLITP